MIIFFMPLTLCARARVCACMCVYARACVSTASAYEMGAVLTVLKDRLSICRTYIVTSGKELLPTRERVTGLRVWGKAATFVSAWPSFQLSHGS